MIDKSDDNNRRKKKPHIKEETVMTAKFNKKSTGLIVTTFAVSLLFLLLYTATSNAAGKPFKKLQKQINDQQVQINVLNNILNQYCQEGSVVSGIMADGTIECTDIDTQKIVFVTSTVHNGALGGVSGADKICQDLADDAGLRGTFKAWISTSESSPTTNFTRSRVPYVLPDGNTMVAQNWYDLTDGELSHAINMNEIGGSVAGDYVWTNTTHAGEIIVDGASSNNCSGFYMEMDLAHVGEPDSHLSAWSDDWQLGCRDGRASLYCFEQ